MSFNPRQLSLYLVTDRKLAGERPLEEVVEAAVKGGVTMVQLREKECSQDEYTRRAVSLKKMLAPYGIPLIINDSVKVALASDADGVHLGQSDGDVSEARRLLGPDKIIGLSIESMEQADAAEYADVDYVAASPVFSTTTKTDAASPLGLEGVRRLAYGYSHPVVGIGGLNASNAGEIIAAGAEGVAVVSAICASPDPEKAASELNAVIEGHRPPLFRIGMIGAGHIAGKVSDTVRRMPGLSCEAIASRSIEKAETFAGEHHFKRAYGSYRELIEDPEIDLIYVATPHSHHFGVTMEAIEAGRPCLVEKAFMANAREAEQVLNLASRRNVFVAEAIWTRYLPAVRVIHNILDSGVIGDVKMISAVAGYSMADKERVIKPELCGGALLDMGVYALNFIRMFHPAEIKNVVTNCILSDTGVDMQSCSSFTLSDGVMASVIASAECAAEKHGVIYGSEGYLVVNTASNPQSVQIFDRRDGLVGEKRCPHRLTGYEYEFLSCRDSIAAGRIEPPEMPHSEILKVMSIMDDLRKRWGVRYPMD